LGESLGGISRALALVGGILLVISGPPHMMWAIPFVVGAGAIRGLLALICGIVALIGAKRLPDLAWGIVLIIVGAIGGGISGLLALIGGAIGIAAKYA
jgi:hypothetical protein